MLNGGGGNDIIRDGSGNDRVAGGAGDDLVFAGLGLDNYGGNGGIDTLDFSELSGGVVLDIAKRSAVIGGETKVVNGFEVYNGTGDADRFIGSNRAETLNGGAGDDWIRSFGGADKLSGGDGADTFVFAQRDIFSGGNRGVDVITDFDAAEDHLQITDVAPKFTGDRYNLVRIEDAGADTIVSVKINNTIGWQKVAVLQGTDAAALQATVKDWLII